MTGLKVGDHVNITVHDGNTIVITPIRKAVAAEVASAAIRKVVKDYCKTLCRLA